jgi:hypothetical protein
MFRRWSEEDPVSLKEIERNNAVYLLQGNRNPFVDRPEFVERIYGPTPPPASPVVRLERQASGLMLLSWDAVTQPPATGYRIERGTGWPATVWTLAAETADTSWTDPLAPAVDSVGMYRVISLRAE